VNIINSVFLENLLNFKSVVFGSRSPVRQTLEAYMTSCDYGFKNIGVGEHGARLTRSECLQKLSTVLRLLGFDSILAYGGGGEREKTTVIVLSLYEMWLETVKGMLGNEHGSFSPTFETSLFWKAYCKLGKPLRRDSSSCYYTDANLLRRV